MYTRPAPRSEHPYYMHDCIWDQPDAISRIIDSQGPQTHELAERITSAQRVHVVGIGTSWHAALVGEYLLRQVGGKENARAWNSADFCGYTPTLRERDVVIVLSHSGAKQSSAQALALAKEAGATTALITCQTSQSRLDLADIVVHTTYRDRSSAFTVSHSGAMTALAMVAMELKGPNASERAALSRLPTAVARALELEGEVQAMVRAFSNERSYSFAGWGPNASTAYEVALKINEATYDVTSAYELEQYIHGPFVATGKGYLTTLVAPPGPGYQRAVTIAQAAKKTQAKVAALVQEGDTDMASVADLSVALPAVPEFLTPIVYLVPLQLFTYWLAIERGRNPDVFRLDDPLRQAARSHYTL